MFLKVLVLNVVLTMGLFAVDSEYYKGAKVGREDVYFPKSDTEYIDHLTEKGGSESYYELAMAHLKLGEKKVAERYIDLYTGMEDNPKKLIRYYRLQGDYGKVEEALEDLMSEADEETRLKYRILIENEVEAKELPMDISKYAVGRVERLFYLRNNEDEFKRYFNGQKWKRSEMDDFVDLLKTEKLDKTSSAEKLFNMFATDRDRLEREYLKITDAEDREGYNSYFSYAEKLEVEPEIKSQFEKGYYLEYREGKLEGRAAEELAGDKITAAENGVKSVLSLKDITFYESRIKVGELKYLEKYIELLKAGGEDVDTVLENLSREAYVAYRLEKYLSLEERDRELGANYLYEKKDMKRLIPMKDYLSKEKLSALSGRSREFKEFYQEKYPFERENIDKRKTEYFYFAENHNISMVTVEELVQKRHLEPQEKYYLAVYYHDKKDYVKSFRETEQLFKRYQLSDNIFKLHADNIKKLKERGTDSEE